MASTEVENKTQIINQRSISEDIGTMLSYAIQQGLKLPSSIKTLNVEPGSNEEVSYYNDLCDVIAPATITSINYINNSILENGHAKRWFQIPIISRSMIIAVIALIAFIVVSLSPDVNVENQANGLLASSGKTLLLNLVFICSASLLGVMFFILKNLNTKIRNYSLLPTDSLEITSSILVGIISGFVISELFSFVSTGISDQIEIQKMTLALLGGFSSDAIFSVLQGIVGKAKAFFTPH